MRSVGLILVALAALTAYGLHLDVTSVDDVVVVAVPEPSAAAQPEPQRPEAAPALAMPASGAATSADAPQTAAAPPASSEPAEQAEPAPVAPPAAPPRAVAAAPATPSPSPAPVPAEAVPDPQPAPAVPSGATPSGATPSLSPAAPAAAGNAASPPASPPAPPAPTGPLDPRIARDAFGAAQTAAPLAARAIGFYSRGCLAGAKMLPVDGPAWQAMRLSRNRNWGHPDLVKYLERFATDVRANDGWPGLLVGDISQPRGGPMKTGHASHQIGLDADIWFTPMPDRRLTPKEREDLAATDMLGPYKLTVDPAVWSPAQVKLIKRASSYREVERILVHPAIKKALCEQAGADRDWLKKVRPYWGHHYHFHVRIACPPGSTTCTGQAPPPHDDGCGKELDDWFALLSRPVKPAPPDAPPAPAPHPLRVDQLPPECRQVLDGREPFYKRFFRSPGAAKAAAKAAHPPAVTGPIRPSGPPTAVAPATAAAKPADGAAVK